MLHKAWSSIEEVPYCFPKSSIKFQGHMDISPISTQIERFWTVNPVWIHQWIWNDAQSLTWYRRSALLFFKVIHQISRSHWRKNWRYESNLRLLGRSQLSNPSDLPCCTKHHWLTMSNTTHSRCRQPNAISHAHVNFYFLFSNYQLATSLGMSEVLQNDNTFDFNSKLTLF